jgi:hypothetical protein
VQQEMVRSRLPTVFESKSGDITGNGVATVLHPKLPGQKKAIPYTEKEKNILHFNCSGFFGKKKRPLVSPTSFYPEWFYNWSLRARPFSNCPFCPVSFFPPLVI